MTAARAADSDYISPLSGNWTDASLWNTNPLFPNNGNGGATFNASLTNGATVTLNQDIVIESFTQSSGTVAGSFNLTLNGNLFWTGGTMSGNGTTAVSGLGSTISGGGALFLSRTLTNSGTFTYSKADTGAQPLQLGVGEQSGVINNSGIFNTTAGGDFMRGNVVSTINNSGDWNVSGAGTTSTVSQIAFNNTGTVNVQSGTLALEGGFTQTAGMVLLNGGSVSTNSTLNFVSGSLQGTGTVTGNVATGGTISPGFSAGRIDIAGDLSLTSSSDLVFQIGGAIPGTEHDLLTEGGSVALNPNGTLSVFVINGFDPTGLSFTVLSSNQNLGSGVFSNVSPGMRLVTDDGIGSFQVNYSPTSSHVMLTDFAAVPEPTTWSLVSLGSVLALGSARRRKARPENNGSTL